MLGGSSSYDVGDVVPVTQGDCLEVMRRMDENSIDAIVTDPPAGISFMNKEWDHDKGGRDQWIVWMTTVAMECLRITKPGGHALVWALPRTSHWTATAWENAGWEIRDKIDHIFGSGFPKSLDVSKAIDKHGGKQVVWFGQWFRKWREDNNISQKQVSVLFPSKTGGLTGCVANWELGFNMPTPEQFNLIRDTFNLPFDSIEEAEREVIGQRKTGIGTGKGSIPIMGDGNRDVTLPATDAAKQWDGWGTALKPAHEDWILMRKPLEGTVAQNILEWETGAINIDACRVGFDGGTQRSCQMPFKSEGIKGQVHATRGYRTGHEIIEINKGRWPANLIHDGSDEVLELFPQSKGQQGKITGNEPSSKMTNTFGQFEGRTVAIPRNDSGSAARFFYTAKASKFERNLGLPEGMKNTHNTVKSLALMRYLCRLITPPGGIVLDPFCGSGSTGIAAHLEGFKYVLIDNDSESIETARLRLNYWISEGKKHG